MVIREDNIRGPNAHYLFDLLAHFKRGEYDGIKVRLGRLQVRHLLLITMQPLVPRVPN